MPYCPICGYEYEEGIEVCSDCDTELVDKLTEDHFDDELVTVYETFSNAQAGMVKELLYNEGIFAATSNEMGSSIMGGTPSEMGDIRVYVAGKDEGRARELVEAYMEDSPFEEQEDYTVCSQCGAKVDEGEEVCPYCGNTLE